MTNAYIQLSDVMLRYGGGTIALDHTTLGIDEGDFVALVGPSGCGKSTILKLVAGLLKPWQLSGGMLQRASLCRALVHDPELLLLDEPFGALDQFTREELWDIMQKLWMDRRPTVLLVTHDLRESAYLANRICVMSSRPGRILETREVGFARPRTLESSYAPEFATLVQQLRMRIADARRDGDATPPAPAAIASLEEVAA